MQQKDCSVYIFSYFLCLVSPTSSLYLLVRLYIVSGLELLFGVMSMLYCALKVETRLAMESMLIYFVIEAILS